MKQQCFDCFRMYDAPADACPFCGYVRGSEQRAENYLPYSTVLSGRYIIGRTCGRGGFGITYKAFDQKMGTVVAIKEYFESKVINRLPGETAVQLVSSSACKRLYKDGLRRFIGEARMMARYASADNIIQIFDYFQENDTAYIVMEYLDGLPLKQYLKQQPEGRVSAQEAVRIILPVCQALSRMHADGIIHRDVTPDNICICTDGSIKLYDLGASGRSRRCCAVSSRSFPPQLPDADGGGCG